MKHAEKIRQYIKEIDDALEVFLEKKEPEAIYDAMRYSIFAGGKRLRPMLLLATCEGLGGQRAQGMPYACALEMIHTYSLIHDDLPAMDDDDYRRGRLSNHKVFGEGMAVLAGDALLNQAFEIMGAECLSKRTGEALLAQQTVISASGIQGMIGGQVLDILSDGKAIKPETLLKIQEKKTAALLQAAFVAGGILAGAEASLQEQLKEIGYCVGIAFQIKDDLLDVTSSQEVLGKAVHSDDKNKKNTYVSVFGFDKAVEDNQRLSYQALERIQSIFGRESFLYELAYNLVDRVK